MKSGPWLLAGVLAAMPLVAAPAASVLAPTAKVAGKSQSDYAVLWWQWANRVPNGVKPYQDPTGVMCGLNQSGDVWFLAGTDGTEDVVRHCTMPVGKHVFLPVIAMLHSARPGTVRTCAEVLALASENNEHLVEAEVNIDGVRLTGIARHRQRTPACFDAYTQAPYLGQPRSYFPAATDGYWLMIPPLKAGLHRLSVRARYDNPGAAFGDLEQVFEYQLQVVDDLPPPPEEDEPELILQASVVGHAMIRPCQAAEASNSCNA